METESSGAGFLKILATIGVVCIWAWVLLIIAGNWSGFPKALQLVMALALPIISLILAYYFTYIQVELRKIGQAFSLLGWLMIWASIALIWQIYNTDGSVWWLLIMWMILVLPLIYVFKLKTLSVLATMLLYGALFYYTEDNRWWFWGKWDDMFALFTIISWLMSVWAYCLNQMLKEKYNYLLYPVAAISLKVLFFVLFMCTIDDWFSFLGDGIAWVILHNVLFLAVIFGTMWWANKNSEILLRHAKNMKDKKPPLKGLIAVISIVVIAVVWFAGIQEYTIQTGEEVYLETMPVDPRDPLRWDFVVLRYAIERDEKVQDFINSNTMAIIGKTIYITLKKEDNTGVVDSVSFAKPTSWLFIKWKIEKWSIDLWIWKYFVPKK